MDYKVTGIVLRSVDYREKDKLIVLYTMELGKITAVLKGVKSEKAKLKFASQLFCFGEFMLNKTGDNFTVLSCNQVDSFYDITKDYDKFSCGGVILEILEKLSKDKMINEQLFIHTLKILNTLTYSETNPKITLLKYMITYLIDSGLRPNLDIVNDIESESIYLHSTEGYFTLEKSLAVYPVPSALFMLLRLCADTDLNDLIDIKCDENTLNRTLKLCRTIMDIAFETKLKNLDKYLDEM